VIGSCGRVEVGGWFDAEVKVVEKAEVAFP